MAYLFLALTIVFEITATTLLKYSAGFTRPPATALCLLAYFVSHLCFSQTVASIDLGIAYAAWCGVGIVATTLISGLVFGECLSSVGLLGIALILIGCLLLNLCG